MDLLTAAEWAAVRLSLLAAVISVACALPFAIGAAWVLARGRFWGRGALDAVVHMPLVLPPVVTGYILLLLFGIRGPFGSVLYHAFGVRLAFTTAAVVLATATMIFPVLVRAIRLSVEAIDAGLDEAARTLGAGTFDRFFSVTLPLMAPGILAGAVVAFAASLGEFGAVITFASNIPGETRTVPLAIYSAIQTPGGDPTAARLAGVSIALAISGLVLSEVLARRVRRIMGR